MIRLDISLDIFGTLVLTLPEAAATEERVTSDIVASVPTVVREVGALRAQGGGPCIALTTECSQLFARGPGAMSGAPRLWGRGVAAAQRRTGHVSTHYDRKPTQGLVRFEPSPIFRSR